ncbi:hypothetical protein [Virgibacillus salexigens]|uniref:Uncharacterized protein n=1 Tax=Virgibacillus massiliensis TaxID=1462526 RepID=A0A024QHK3_9BACI|nr:hypothetical protein [Virgibacillus massiliensis]CDQ41742.1 hypothetical protein BN990_04119 [Virgibacillus massiliensis]
MKFWITSFLIGFIAFFTTSIDTEASTTVDINKMEPTKVGHIYYDEEYDGYYDVKSGGYIEVYKVQNGEVVKEIDTEDYIDRLSKEPNVPEDTDTLFNVDNKDSIGIMAPSIYYRYSESSNVRRTQYGSRASIIQKNPGPGSDTMSIAYSASKGHSFNVSLGTGERSAVRSGVSYTWVSSESISSSHTMTIPAGYKGYWRFDPYVRVSNGTVRKYNQGVYISSKRVRATYPVRINGVLDGELIAVKSPL